MLHCFAWNHLLLLRVCVTMVSHNVAITTSYADGELFAIEMSHLTTNRKGSQNEPRTIWKGAVRWKSSIQDVTGPTPSLLFSSKSAAQQLGKDSCRAHTFISHHDNGVVALKRSTRRGGRGLRRADFTTSEELLLNPNRGAPPALLCCCNNDDV